MSGGVKVARLKTKREQREYVGPRARELARTGDFSDWYDIERYLRSEELCREARHVLDDELIRAELDTLCRHARNPASP